MKMTTSAALAEEWGLTEEQLHRRRRRNGWPCVRLSRDDIRFTDLQIEQIVAMQSTEARVGSKRSTGQTSRSQKAAS